MDEQERKQIWMQELQDAAKGKDKIIADYAQQAVQCCNDGIPWAGVFNYGWMRMAEGMKHQQEISANELYFLICGVLFEPEKQEHKEEIRQHFSLVTDNKKSLDRFINGLEIVGKALQAGQRIGAIKDAELIKSNEKVKALREEMHKAMTERDAAIKRTSGRQQLSQKQAAEIAGVSVRTIKNWDKGIGAPPWYKGRNMTCFQFRLKVEWGKQDQKISRGIQKNLQRPVSLDKLNGRC